ncbi:5'-nucleotidase, lipoprotein e(P4) family [Sphingomonas sp. EC-HK361]|uniref:HAD family acid phosphatase n=1 Tax=Sphingomonas sp. EC-HK361 TaxID=2038397 RepID=UPI0012521B6D|nr:HAD family acid phosphatase [Sphingomonas sp. EC-HK361]VVT03624.1 5'-nucleotidase, lipoprotein e(P4) family [Sphingomonas sp. EC-HK361]
MSRTASIALLLGAASLTGGCVAAAIPVAAGGVIAKNKIGKRDRDAPRKPTREERRAAAALPALGGTAQPGQIYRGNLPPPSGVAAAPAPASARGPSVPAGMQYLYGSGEATAASLQAYLALNDWMVAKATARRIGDKVDSVVLAPGATLASPRFLPCGDKPLAVVLDVDETSLLNLGYEADDSQRGTGYDAQRWDAWEKTGGNAVAAVPGVLEAKAVADSVGVTFVYNSNRAAANAGQTAATLTRAGLGPAAHGSTLWLQGDVGGGSGKDARRAAIADKYCVIAMVGDQLGDFSDLFNAPGEGPQARRAFAASKALKTIWGHGWFVLPNPVYGTALKGGLDDVFPADKRWSPTAAATK